MDDFYPNMIRELLLVMGDDPEREGLKETPDRVLRSYKELFWGYGQEPASAFKAFKEDGPRKGMIIIKGISYYSTCEHHLLPFYGTAFIGYIPNNDTLIGLSKPARLVRIFSRRLQVQERMTEQIVNAMDFLLQPLGCGCVTKGYHLCSMARGVKQERMEMEYSTLRGNFLEEQKVRDEFFSRIPI